MSVTTNDRRKQYPGDGVTTVFNGPMAYSATTISATLVDDITGAETSAGSFTVTQLGKTVGTRITMVVPPPIGQTLVLLRTVAYAQGTDITNQGAFNASVLEGGMDQIVFQTQQLADQVGRSPQLPPAGVDGLSRYNANGNKLGGLADGTEAADAATVGQIAGMISIPTGPYVAGVTGAVLRPVQDKLRETVSVKDFGALGNGVANDTAAIQSAITRAATDGFNLQLPDGNYLVTGNLTQTGVLVMSSMSQGRATITKTGTGDLFSGESAVIQGINFVHQGTSGRILNLVGDGARAEGCNFTNAAANASDMIHCTRSDHFFGRNYFTNNNATAYAIHVERTSAGICINGAIESRNTFGGIGRGVRFSSSVGGARPEGWTFNDNTVILTGDRHITIESMLHLSITGNVLDQGSGTCVDFSPNADNIDSVAVVGNYIATASAPLTGVGLNTQGGTGSIFNLRVENNHCENCDYGFALNPKVSEFIVAGNTFANINTESVRYAGAVRGAISGNVFRGANVHLQLIDGATGQAISVCGNVFPATGSVAATFTDRTRFEFRGNVGKRFDGFCSGTGAANAGTVVAVSVPHGLALTPNIDRITASVQQVTGDHQNTTVKIVSVDATNVNIGIYYAITAPGNLRANLYVSV